MRKYRVLSLTDHSGHSPENSIYALLSSMVTHTRCEEVVVASRSNKLNKRFFEQRDFSQLHVLRIDANFNYAASRNGLNDVEDTVDPFDVDIIFLRLPRPTTDEFLKDLEAEFGSHCIVNKPSGIIKCGNKAVLLDFQDVCPPLKVCHSIKDVQDFSKYQNIVLKPLRAYGGKGLVRIKDGVLNDGLKNHPIMEYLESIESALESDGYLAMRYLENVSLGDKRLIVVGGEILASVLRVPAGDSWLCNVAMGGTSVKSEPDEREREIIKRISPYLLNQGVLIFGADTLVDDDGWRVLSEINALSIGGFPQAEKQTGRPVINPTLNKIFQYADDFFEG